MQISIRSTGTSPVIIHSPGFTLTHQHKKTAHARHNPLWKYLLKHWNQAPPPRQPGPDISRDMTIITWNTESGKSILEQSLDKLGVPYTVLGREQKNWSNTMKMDLSRKFLKTVTTPYVLALDAYDILVLDHPAKALKRFQQMDCDILFNASRIFYPDFSKQDTETHITDTWKRFQQQVGRPPWTFVNAGACIAGREAYLDFAKDCLSRDILTLIRKNTLPGYYGKYNRKTQNIEQVRVNWCFMDWFPRVQADCGLQIFMPTRFFSRKDIRLKVPVHKIPAEWLTFFSASLQSRVRPVFSVFLDRTRSFRGRLGLRRIQWKNRFGKTW